MFVNIKKERLGSRHPPPLYKNSQISLPEVCPDKDRKTSSGSMSAHMRLCPQKILWGGRLWWFNFGDCIIVCGGQQWPCVLQRLWTHPTTLCVHCVCRCLTCTEGDRLWRRVWNVMTKSSAIGQIPQQVSPVKLSQNHFKRVRKGEEINSGCAYVSFNLNLCAWCYISMRIQFELFKE